MENSKEIIWNFDYEFNGNLCSETRFIIYKIENKISGTVYIGQTRRELRKRWADYKKDLLKPIEVKNRKGSNLKLKRSVQKHYSEQGNINFLWFSIVEVVDVSLLTTDEEKQKLLNEREQSVIKEYRLLYGRDKVCNVLDGGRQHVWTEEEKIKNIEFQKEFWSSPKGIEITTKKSKKQSESLKEFYQTEEGLKLKKLHKEKLKSFYQTEDGIMLKRKISEVNKQSFDEKYGLEKSLEKKKQMSLLQSGKGNVFYGKTHKEESKKKMSAARKGTNLSQEQKNKISASLKGKTAKIHDFSLNPLVSPDGVVYNNVFNMKQFCKENNLSAGSLFLVISGKRKSHKSWHLKFNNNLTT